MPSAAFTATAVLTCPGDQAQAGAVVREGLGPRATFERDGDALVARCGSRAAYRLWGVWARPAQLPVRARIELTAHDGGTQVAVRMTSDEGWYAASTTRAGAAYRARFEAVVTGLQRAGLSLVAPVAHG